MTTRESPKFTGIIIHRDPLGRFSVRYPTGWHTFDIREEAPLGGGADGPVLAREGIGFAPNPRDPHTALTMWVAPLEHSVVAEDLAELKQAVDEGLQALDECVIESASEAVLGNLIKFERIYTFREHLQPGDAGAIRKRKQWLLYVDTWLMCLTWQGSSPEEYQYWFAMANYSFLTFEIPEALWFATDRDLAGIRASLQSQITSA
jgi:hypothetical protein